MTPSGPPVSRRDRQSLALRRLVFRSFGVGRHRFERLDPVVDRPDVAVVYVGIDRLKRLSRVNGEGE